MNPNQERFTGVQILRFVAAMLVVAMHVTQAISMHITGKGPMVYWSPGGGGVDIFFVISGFVMAITTKDLARDGAARMAAAWVFMKRRILRIVPLYWFYTLLKAALLIAVPAAASRSTFDLGHFAASLLFLPATPPGGGVVQPILQVGWTLNFEMLFYAVFAIAIALGAPRIRFCLLVFLGVFLAAQLFPQSVPLAFYGQSIIFEFIFGVMIAYAFTRFGSPHPLIGVALMVAGFAFALGTTWSDGWDRLMPWGVGATMIVLGTVWMEPLVERVPGWRQLSFLGDSSYSLYLSHAFVVPAGVLLLRRVGVQDLTVIFIAVSVLCVVVGALSHLWLEKPMTSFFKRFLFRETRPSYAHAANTPAK